MRFLVAATLLAILAAPGRPLAQPDSTAANPDSAAALEDQAEAEADTAAADSTAAAPGRAAAPAAADTSHRVTGSRFRFGSSVESVQRYGNFPVVKTPGRPREVARGGYGHWFGLEGDYTLFFLAGKLQRVQFQAREPSRRAIDYVKDQLRSSGFRPECSPPGGVTETCTWRGPTSVRLLTTENSLEATVEPPRAPRAPRVVDAPEVFVIGRSGHTSRLPLPQVTSSPPPEYPAEASAARVQGNVWVKAQVDTSGVVQRVNVIRGIPELEAAAILNALQWRFAPYRINGAPARFEVEFPVRFVLP